VNLLPLAALVVLAASPPLGPGDHTRTLQLDGRERSYLVHIPPKLDLKAPAPVVLIFHGMAMNARGMVGFCGLSKKADDGTKVRRKTYGPGKEGTEVVLFVIEGGGHTWPGEAPPLWFLGKSAKEISANDLMWEFFKKHPIRKPPAR
jgi:poly(3-hydroxybutyrate) depolymerase